MRRPILRIALLGGLLALGAAAPEPPEVTHGSFEEDFQSAWREIGSMYAYFQKKATRWNDVPRLYAPDLARVSNKGEFIDLLERVMDELYDPHAQLTVNTPASPRLVPSGTDLWAEWRAGEAVITEVRDGSDAREAGIRPGAVVLGLNGVAIAEAAAARMGRSYPHTEAAARDWALRAVLAGTHGSARSLLLREGEIRRTVELPAPDQWRTRRPQPLTRSEPRPGIGCIRFNDSLGDQASVAAFDEALAALRQSRALVVDLRDTPSGGNSSVARGVLGRFVRSEAPYQEHALPSEERETGIARSWLELVSPRGSFVYERPVAVLVDHWTGSMGEGLAIGFDGTGRGTVIGTPMAGLLGATYHVTLPKTGIGLNVPAERLYHVRGTPREEFRPTVAVDLTRAGSEADPILAAALRFLAGRREGTDLHRGI
ncbi:MAG: S41 family peptidase [Acidobacteriota bacterium]|nr:S41 family peptidase [Acidobacteriota bacterium]